MAEFASVVQRGLVNKPVIDKTGLSGRYNFDLQWSPDGAANLFTALQQLGLALVPAQGLVDIVVVDNAEQPQSRTNSHVRARRNCGHGNMSRKTPPVRCSKTVVAIAAPVVSLLREKCDDTLHACELFDFQPVRSAFGAGHK